LTITEFINEAQVVLANQPRDNVESFFEQVEEKLIPFLVARPGDPKTREDNELSDLFTTEQKAGTRLSKEENDLYRKALKHLIGTIELAEKGVVKFINLDDIYDELTRIHTIFIQDIVLQTSGRRSSLDMQDLIELMSLQLIFSNCFPERTAEFKEYYLLGQLGVALVGKPIPKSFNSMVEKLIYWGLFGESKEVLGNFADSRDAFLELYKSMLTNIKT